ncbi:MAG: glycosyltransferase family 2 protein [Lachnospiraceae bacterium]|nr:glycosyltransferase family 2 protein [Lachnospiraceae bacterium]
MDRIAVLIPCYNEELSVAKVVNDARKYLPEAAIYVYDNNSTDDTVARALEAGAIVRYEYMQGKGNVIRRMFKEIDAKCYIMVDGDDTYDLSSVRELADLVLEKQADMVVGDRLSSTYYSENKRPFHNFGNSLVKASINKLFDCKINDIMTGYRAFSYQFVKSFPVMSRGFEIETEMTIFAVNNNMQVDNVVIGYKDRQEGSYSKLDTYSDGFKVIGTIIRLYREYRPLKFFTLISAILAILSVLFVIPVLIDYANTGLVLRFPTLIVCGFVFIAAIQSLFAGMILNNVAQRNRMETELRMYDISDRLRDLEEAP